MHRFTFSLAVAAILSTSALSFPQSASAQDAVGEAARGLLEKYKLALVVVTVDGRLQAVTDGDPLPDREQQRRTLGVTIRDNGLIAISNASVDPAVGLEGQKARMGDKVVTIQSAKTEFVNVEISYGDKTILPGKIIKQDVNSDIAFVLPDAGAAQAIKKQFTFVDLKQAAQVQVADEVVGLSRSSAAFFYMPTVIVGRVTAIHTSDRTFYITTAGTAQGIPIFALDGRPVGITLERILDNNRSGILGTIAAGSISIMADIALDAASKEGAAAPATGTPAPAAPAAPAPAPAAPPGN
ncbi:MAG: hypothetical protein H7A52_15610 [Akkermansiaceae bacterium]|nr:hypothetical protein [Akkermansiaceae bacterium]